HSDRRSVGRPFGPPTRTKSNPLAGLIENRIIDRIELKGLFAILGEFFRLGVLFKRFIHLRYDQSRYIEIGTDIKASFAVHHVIELLQASDFFSRRRNRRAHLLHHLILSMLKHLVELLLITA